MITIEVAAKTVQKAIEEGLLKLSKSIDEVDIKIISSGGLFKKAKVEITVLEDEKPVPDTKPIQETKEKEKPQEKTEGRKEIQKTPPFANPEQKQENKAKPNPAQKQQERQPHGQNQNHQKQKEDLIKLEQKTQKTEQKSEKIERKPFEQKTEKTEWKPFEQKSENTERKPFEQKTEKTERKPFEQKSEKPNLQTNTRNIKEKGYQPFRQKQDNPHNYDKAITDDGIEKTDEHRQRPKADITEEAAKQAYAFVDELLKKMDAGCAITSEIVDGDLKLGIECDTGAVIGYRGETLDAIEYLTSLAINKNDDKYYRICIDCNDYRSKRVETLSGLAHRMAEKAVKTGRKVVLEPMSSSSRKIIHSVLSSDDRIITKSEGREPNRRIVIIPKRYRQVNESK